MASKLKEKKKANYVFGNVLGNAMSKVDMRTQLEASMMSMTLMLVGMIVTTFYLAFYYNPPMWYKVTLIINLLAAMVFMSSFLITSFQQYQSYLTVMEFQKDMKGGSQQNAKKNTKRITNKEENRTSV